jgi:anti-sigma factor RsiW
MNIEETLWNYIDGNCTADEQKAITTLIASDEACRLKYNELLKLNNEFSAMELDEPPMAFTYNVMEDIRAEQAQKPLKAAINKRIVLGLAIFFVITIAALLVFTLASMQPMLASDGAAATSSGFTMPDLSQYLPKPLIEAFFFFDVVLALYLFDTFIRKKKMQHQVH